MKRLFATAAILPLVLVSAARGETKISNAVTVPLMTSTAANGSPDDLTIEAAGSVKPTGAGAAVTLDSDNAVNNGGTISFNNLDGSTGIQVIGGHTGSVINTGSVSVVEDYTPQDIDMDGDLDGPLAQGSGRFGVRTTGISAFVGDIRNDVGGSITIEGDDSAGISVETQLSGNLVNAGSISVLGDRSTGLSAQHVTGDVRVTGAVMAQGAGAVAIALDDVDGGVRLQNGITATGFRSTTRASDDARAKLDADDLLIGGAAVRITGSVAKGILLDIPPPDHDPNDADDDKDGVPDAQERTANVASFGSAPALDIGSAKATTIGAVGTDDLAYGLVNRGLVVGSGVNDGIGAIGIRIGQVGGGSTSVAGGINNLGGSINASAFGAETKAEGGDAVALLINPGAVVPALRNSGTIQADLTGGSQDAMAIVDRSGSLASVENSGVIGAAATPRTGSANVGRAVALDVSANTGGVVLRQFKATDTSKPAISGDVIFGSGSDQLLLSGGSLTGNVAFGAGADLFRIEGGATATGQISDSDGNLALQVLDGRLAASNAGTVQLSGLELGSKGVLVFNLEPAHSDAPRLQVSGAARFDAGAQIELNLSTLLKTPQNLQLVQANSIATAATGVVLTNAPFLYAASLNTATPGSLSVDLRPKTAVELGLNRSGAQAYSAVFASLDQDAEIQNAVLAQKTQAGFQALYDQLLPDHSGGSLMSAVSISGAISQAVGQALPRDGQGGSAIWAQEIAFHIDRDREQAQGYTSHGYGLATGGELVGEANALGVALSFVASEYQDRGAEVGERVVMNFTEAATYWRVRSAGFQADARVGLGYVWFDSDRRLGGAGLARSAKAKWNGWLADAHAGASYAVHAGRFYVRPEASIDYLRLNEDGYREAGGGAGFDLKVDSREGDLLTGQALLALGWEFGDESWWAPELKVGWRQKISGAPGATSARFQDGATFTLDGETPASSGAVVRLGFKGGGEAMYFALDAGGAVADGTQEYDLRGTLRFRF